MKKYTVIIIFWVSFFDEIKATESSVYNHFNSSTSSCEDLNYENPPLCNNDKSTWSCLRKKALQINASYCESNSENRRDIQEKELCAYYEICSFRDKNFDCSDYKCNVTEDGKMHCARDNKIFVKNCTSSLVYCGAPKRDGLHVIETSCLHMELQRRIFENNCTTSNDSLVTYYVIIKHYDGSTGTDATLVSYTPHENMDDMQCPFIPHVPPDVRNPGVATPVAIAAVSLVVVLLFVIHRLRKHQNGLNKKWEGTMQQLAATMLQNLHSNVKVTKESTAEEDYDAVPHRIAIDENKESVHDENTSEELTPKFSVENYSYFSTDNNARMSQENHELKKGLGEQQDYDNSNDFLIKNHSYSSTTSFVNSQCGDISSGYFTKQESSHERLHAVES